MKVIIDRIEGEFAVAEFDDGRREVCPRAIFPEEAKEGDIIEITVCEEETESRRQEMKNKMNKLFKD